MQTAIHVLKLCLLRIKFGNCLKNKFSIMMGGFWQYWLLVYLMKCSSSYSPRYIASGSVRPPSITAQGRQWGLVSWNVLISYNTYIGPLQHYIQDIIKASSPPNAIPTSPSYYGLHTPAQCSHTLYASATAMEGSKYQTTPGCVSKKYFSI